MTQSTDKIDKALTKMLNIKRSKMFTIAAENVGIHLEGPFISENKVGAQHPQYVVRHLSIKLNIFDC